MTALSEVASAFVSLVPSARNFGSKMNSQLGPQINSSAKTAGSRFGKVFAYSSMSPLKAIGAAAVGLFAVQKVKEFFGSAIDEARESQKVSALTAQVIKSTGGAANISAKQIGALSSAISLKTGIDDEAIQSGANLLLTFKGLRNEAGKGNDVFNQATQTITDMSVALGTDVKGSAIQVGKALNDPVKGITALTRVGVTFTQQQKDQIAAMVDSGNTLGAQKIILKELNSEFGGAAGAAATAGDKFKTAFANFQEAVGTALLPYLDKALNVGTKFISFLMQNVPPAFAAVKAAIMPVAQAVGDFVSAHLQPFLTLLSGLGGAAIAAFAALIGGTLVSALGILIGALASPVAIIGALAGAAVYAYMHFEGFRTTVNNLVAALKANLVPVLTTAATTFQTVILPAVIAFAQYVAANLFPVFQKIAQIVVTQVLPILSSLAQFVYGQLYPAIVQIVVAVGQKLKPVFDALVTAFQTQVIPAIQSLLAKFREHQPAIQAAVLAVTKIIGKVLEFAAAVLAKVLPVVIRFEAFMAGKFISGIGTAIGIIVAIVKAVIKVGDQFITGAQQIADFAKKVGQYVAKALKVIDDIPSKVKAALSGAATLLYSAGQDIIRGLINGIKSMAGAAADAAKDAVKGALDGAKGLLGIHSPSTKFAEVGMWSMLGLKKGIDDNADGPAHAVAVAVERMRATLEKQRDKIKSVIDGLKSDFASLSSSVASAFTGDAFSATNQTDFFSNLLKTQGTLQHLRRAFKKLLKWGLDPKFLSQLFQSGNSALIFDLADGTKAQALVDSQIFTANQGIAGLLGGSVAQADLGPELRRQTHRLDQIEDHLKHLPKNIGHEINGSVRHGQRKAS